MTAEKWGPVILRERRLKISTLPELNDPFELLGASIGEKDMRRIMRILHMHWAETLGMICLTDNWQNPVMWAHYAARHHGLCLGFDVSERPGLVSKVDYVPDRLRHVLQHKKRLLGVDEALLVQVLRTKYQEWAYEREYRVFAELKDRSPNGLYYVDFGPDLTLREVILGSRCELTLPSVAAAIKEPEKAVEIFKARPAFSSFRIVRQNNVRGIKIEAGRPI